MPPIGMVERMSDAEFWQRESKRAEIDARYWRSRHADAAAALGRASLVSFFGWVLAAFGWGMVVLLTLNKMGVF